MPLSSDQSTFTPRDPALHESTARRRESTVRYTHASNGRTWELFGCAKRGCDAVNPGYLSFGVGDQGYCLHHIPLRCCLTCSAAGAGLLWVITAPAST